MQSTYLACCIQSILQAVIITQIDLSEGISVWSLASVHISTILIIIRISIDPDPHLFVFRNKAM